MGTGVEDKIARVLKEISDGLTEEERVAFYRSLAIISESLERVCKSSEDKKG